MLETTIKHGDLCVEYLADKSVRIVRQSDASHIQLSISEWYYLLKVAEIHEWPMAPPAKIEPGPF